MLLLTTTVLFALDLPDLRGWTTPAIGAAATALAFGVGLALFCNRRTPGTLLPTQPKGPVAPPVDPFVQGSSSERRVASRREGNNVEVHITDAELTQRPELGRVVDRSVGGLCLLTHAPLTVGDTVNVRPHNATAIIPWTAVEVRSCRQNGDTWEVGCQFVRSPPWSVLLLFG